MAGRRATPATRPTVTPASLGGGGGRPARSPRRRDRGRRRRSPARRRRRRDGRRAAGEHDGVGGWPARQLVGCGPARDRAVGDDGLDVVTGRGQPVGERRPGPVGLGQRATSRRPAAAGTRRAGPRPARRAGTTSTGRPASAASTAAVAGPTAASRTCGWPAAAAPTRLAPLADVTTSQSNVVETGERSPAGDATVGGIGDGDQWRRATTSAPSSSEAVAELAGLGSREGDAASASPTDRHAGPARRRARARSRSPLATVEHHDVVVHDGVVGGGRGRRAAVRRRRGRRAAASTRSPARRGTPARRSTAWRVGAWSTAGRAPPRGPVVGAGLDGDAALADGGHEHRRVEALGDALREAEHLEGGDGHHDRPVLRDPVEAGGDVAAQLARSGGRGGLGAAGPAGARTRSPRWRHRRGRPGPGRPARRPRRGERVNAPIVRPRGTSTAGPWPSAPRRRRARRARPAAPP